MLITFDKSMCVFSIANTVYFVNLKKVEYILFILSDVRDTVFSNMFFDISAHADPYLRVRGKEHD